MSLVSRTYYVNPGDYILSHPDIAFTVIYGVKREGTGQTEVSGTPGNREFQYDSTGKIIFDSANPFSPPPPPEGMVVTDMSAEKIWVLFNE